MRLIFRMTFESDFHIFRSPIIRSKLLRIPYIYMRNHHLCDSKCTREIGLLFWQKITTLQNHNLRYKNFTVI